MDQKFITLITGSNQGLGLETARILLRSPDYHVIIASRAMGNGEEAVRALLSIPDVKGSAETIKLDVTSDEYVDSAAESVSSRYGRLDVLVNNAGICPQSSFGGRPSPKLSARQAVREVFDTNVAGAVSVTEAFLPLLRKSKAPRVVFVSSSTGSLTLMTTPGHRLGAVGRTEYRASKAALNLIMVQYWHTLKDEGFVVLGADPGLNATGLTGDVESLKARGAQDPSVGGERIARVVRGERDNRAGKLCGEAGTEYGDTDIVPW